MKIRKKCMKIKWRQKGKVSKQNEDKKEKYKLKWKQ